MCFEKVSNTKINSRKKDKNDEYTRLARRNTHNFIGSLFKSRRYDASFNEL